MPTGYCALYARTHHVVTSCAKHVLFTHAAARAIQPNLNNDHIARSLRMSIAGQYRGTGHQCARARVVQQRPLRAVYTASQQLNCAAYCNLPLAPKRTAAQAQAPEHAARTAPLRASSPALCPACPPPAAVLPQRRRRAPSRPALPLPGRISSAARSIHGIATA